MTSVYLLLMELSLPSTHPHRKASPEETGVEMSPKIYRVELNAFMNIQVLNNPSAIVVFKKIITNCFQISMGARCCQLVV